MLDNSRKSLKFYRLLSLAGLSASQVSYLTIYDQNIFFDYIARVDNKFINFCLINDRNLARYQIFFKLEEWLKEHPCSMFDMPVINVIELDGDKWFYEEMSYYNDINNLTFDDCLLINEKIVEFNQHVQKFASTVDYELSIAYNSIIKEYRPSYLQRDKTTLSLEYGDVGTMFDCNRISKIDNVIKFTGYQSFLFYDNELTSNLILVKSMLTDTYDEKVLKISHIKDENIPMLEKVIAIQEERIGRVPQEHYKNTSDILMHLNEIKEILWKK